MRVPYDKNHSYQIKQNKSKKPNKDARLRRNHIPVLLKEVVEFLDPQANQNFIDATIGGGGHTKMILEKIQPNGKVLGIDWNEDAVFGLRQTFEREIKENRLVLVCDNFSNLSLIIEKTNFREIHGVLFDLGLSSTILEKSGRGFSFMRDEPLLMNYHGKNLGGPTAKDLVNNLPQNDLADIFWRFGQERFSRRISEAIAKERKFVYIERTSQLVKIIEKAVPGKFRKNPYAVAARIFQALRIAVNDELNHLKDALPQAIESLTKRGKVVVISYHSLEDKIVKESFRAYAKTKKFSILTAKPSRPTPLEIRNNPRSRSAKLRAIQKF